MKLVIISSTVVAGGKVAERGAVYNTAEEDKTADREAYQLIASGRALEFKTPEAQKFLEDFAVETKKVEAKKAEAAQVEKANKGNKEK